MVRKIHFLPTSNGLFKKFVTANFRLEPEKDDSKGTSRTYIVPRLFHLVTSSLWGFFVVYFRVRIYTEMSGLCPGGNLAAVGGKKKRNIQSLGKVHVTGVKLSF